MRGLVNGFISGSTLSGSSLILGLINGFVSCSASSLSKSCGVVILNGFVSCSLFRLAVLAESSRERK